MIFWFLFSISKSVAGGDAITNPSFENGTNGYFYSNGKKDCTVVSTMAQDGTKSLYCKITNGSYQGTLSQYVLTSKILPMFNYELSTYVRMNKCSDKLLIFVESLDYKSAVYLYSDSNTSCKTNDCWSSWNKISAQSASTLKNNSNKYVFGFRVQNKGTCEFYLDNIQFKPITDNIELLRSVEIQAWRHEVYKEKVNIFVDLVIKDTHWEKGNDMKIYVEIIDEETNKVKLKLTNWKLVKREENFVALFVLDSSKLKSGYYDAKATLINTFLDNKVETASTYFHVLNKKREYGIYVDKKLRVIKQGKPFFPLGLMCGDCKSEYFSDYFVDSPFNLIKLGGTHTKKQIDELFEKGNRQLYIMDSGYSGIITKYYNVKNETINAKVDSELKKYINNIKDSPGFFGYYSVDEVDVGLVPRMKLSLKTTREVDFDHPVYGVLNQRLLMHIYKEGLDCYGTDIYPGDNYDDLRAVYTVTYQGRDEVVNNLANWGVPQFFDWTIYGRKNESPPSKQQMLQTMYQMLVGGANGIIWFDFHEMTKTTNVNWKPYWEDLKNITKNFKEKYVPIFLSEYDPDPGYDKSRIWANQVNSGRPCGLRFFRYNKKDYILAVNPWRKQNKKCVFDVPAGAKDFKIIEGTSTMTRDGNKIILQMPLMDVTWLEATNDEYPYKEGSGSSTGVVAGLVVLLLMIIIVLVYGIFVYIRKRESIDKEAKSKE